jgi:hypothetical protein
LFIVAAVFAFASMYGEGAEELVEDMLILEKIIHEHEELAEGFSVICNWIFSLLSLYTSLKNKFAKIVSYVTLILPSFFILAIE